MKNKQKQNPPHLFSPSKIAITIIHLADQQGNFPPFAILEKVQAMFPNHS